jgi:flavin-dependent dehydrogenase
MTPMSPSIRCDVAIIGAGPAGAATALALSSLDVGRIVLLAPHPSNHHPPIGESLPPESRLLLQRLGVWSTFVTDDHDACLGTCSSWGSDTLGYNDFLLNPHGPGWHLDRARFDARLVEHALANGVDLCIGAQVRTVHKTPDADGFVLDTGPQTPKIHTRFVVDATGSTARIARALGAHQRRLHQLTCAVVFLSKLTTPTPNKLAILEAVDYGWWYAARLPRGEISALVATDPTTLKKQSLHTWEGWITHLHKTRHLAPALNHAIFAKNRIYMRAAPSTILEPCIGDGWLAVGDAACTFDPLMAQGIYKALLNGLEAAPAIAQWLAGNPKELDGYSATVNARFDEYQLHHNYFYRQEQRWPNAPFWWNKTHITPKDPSPEK